MSSEDSRSDQALVQASNDGDVSGFEGIYSRYRDWVYRLAYRFTGNEADALDVLQDTFAYLLGKFPGLELTAAMTSFLYPVVKHLALRRRDKSARMPLLDQTLTPEPAAQGDNCEVDRRQDMRQILARLPETQREVVLMRFVDEMALAEIASALEIPIGTVKSRLHNALQSLRTDDRVREYFEI